MESNLLRRGVDDRSDRERYGTGEKGRPRRGVGRVIKRDQVFAHLAYESVEFISGLQDWRSAHPIATFAEIEVAVDRRLDQLRA